MKIENPVAFYFIMQDELYLLKKDKDLYNSISAKPVAVSEPEPLKLKYSGANTKGFLIVVHYPEQEFMADRHLAALENTLKRLGYDLDDAAIFNRAVQNEVRHAELTDFFKPEKILFLGAEAVPIGINGLILNERTTLNGSKVLLTFSFDEMMDNTENKKTFWEQIKQL